MTPTLDYEEVGTAVCPRCGIQASEQHESKDDCIDALRDVIAVMELKQDARPRRPAAPRVPGSGGYRNRPDARMVILDGERLTLTEAGRRLGVTASTLHFRIARRLCDNDYKDVDIRAIHADVRRTRDEATAELTATHHERMATEMSE